MMPEELADLRVGAFFFGNDDQQRGALHAPGECAELAAAAGCSRSFCLDAYGIRTENTGRAWKEGLLEDHLVGRSVDDQGRWTCDEVGEESCLSDSSLRGYAVPSYMAHGLADSDCVSLKFNTGAWLPGDDVCHSDGVFVACSAMLLLAVLLVALLPHWRISGRADRQAPS